MLISDDKTYFSSGYIGKNGMNKKTEGDLKTPVGIFGIITAFGIKPKPETALPYIRITDDIYCCSDTQYYNKIIDIKKNPHNCLGEHMSDFSPEYDYGIFIDYNKECIYKKGSAIFVHCKGNKYYTGGCVALEKDFMLLSLRTLCVNSKIIIF